MITQRHLLLAIALLIPAACLAQVHDVLCRAGDGSFAASFRNIVKVSVGPKRDGELATRACQATLSWGNQKLVVASGVAQLDLDVFGADFGSREPAAGFATAKSDDTCCMTYQIYSLTEPPALLRTITGGGFYSATDTDLDGRVEIWTDDSAAVDGLDGLSASEIEFVPTYVLRLNAGLLVDASSEFREYYDEVIQKVRSKMQEDRLREFKASDGRLKASPGTAAPEFVRLHKLRAVKIQALEIVWAYLYSGRDKEAWESLREMWPTSDQERVRDEIVKARSRGIQAQLDGVPQAEQRGKWKKAAIYHQTEVTPAKAIVMRVYPPEDQDVSLAHKEVQIDLVVDAAGKVRSVKPRGGKVPLEPYIEASVSRWKFIPAFKAGRPVASQMHTSIFALR